MYAKNSFMDMKYSNKNCKKIIDFFEKAYKNNIKELTITFLLHSTTIDQIELYEAIEELLELEVLDLKEYSICPNCSNQDNFNNNVTKRCSYCKSVYIPNNIVEKLKLNKGKYYYEN
mgnify:CR=1 FL=1